MRLLSLPSALGLVDVSRSDGSSLCGSGAVCAARGLPTRLPATHQGGSEDGPAEPEYAGRLQITQRRYTQVFSRWYECGEYVYFLLPGHFLVV